MNHKTNSNSFLLCLDPRSLPIERWAEIQAAADRGYSVVMASPNIDQFRGFGLAHLIEVDVGDYDQAESVILNELEQNDLKISGVLAWKDREVQLASKINGTLGLPGTPLSAVPKVRNKAETRSMLMAKPESSPLFAAVRSEAEFLAAFERIGTPSLLKPSGNSGTRGMFKINGGDDPLETYRNFCAYNNAQNGDMYRYYNHVNILEQFLIGSEHSVAGMVVDGEVVIFSIADKKNDLSVPIQYQNVTPSRLAKETQNSIVELTRWAVKMTGINWCGFHVDIIVTPEGPKILEIGGRLGGECINSHLIPLSQPWLKPYEALIEVVQGRNPFKKNDYREEARRFAATYVIRPPRPGQIKNIRGLEQVWRHPNTRIFMQMHGPGNQMYRPADKFKAYEIGYVILQCSADEDIDAIMEEIESLVTIEMEET